MAAQPAAPAPVQDSIPRLEPRIRVDRVKSAARQDTVARTTAAPVKKTAGPVKKVSVRGGDPPAPQRPSPEDAPPPPEPAPKVVVAPQGDDLPKFGEYVYVEELPEAMVKVPPAYPDAAREAHVEGTVMVQALIGRDGMIKDTKIVKSVPGLDDAASSAVRQWQFKPAMAKGVPVATWVAIPVKFAIH